MGDKKNLWRMERNLAGKNNRADKSAIPVCNIMGVEIAAIDMNWLIEYIRESVSTFGRLYLCCKCTYSGYRL